MRQSPQSSRVARDEVVLTYTDKKSPCLVGLEEFLSETTSADQIDTGMSASDSDQEDFSVSVASTSTIVSTSNPILLTHTAPLPVIYQSDSVSLAGSLRKLNLDVYDKRDRGGCLWVVGGYELQMLMDKLRADGFKFSFTPNGSRTTRHRPAWYLK